FQKTCTLAAALLICAGAIDPSQAADKKKPAATAPFNEQEVVKAANAFADGKATPAQEKLILQHNDVVNRMATRGQISNATYQKAQAHFDNFNSEMTARAAADANLVYGKQKSSGKPAAQGTDSDYILKLQAQAAGDMNGRGIKPAEIQKAKDSYNNRMNEEF